MKFTYYGHAAFSLSDGTTTILFDPFITGNTWTKVDPASIKCQYIVLSHAHDDHYGDTDVIAKANKAVVISTAEVAGLAGSHGCLNHAMHIGGAWKCPWGTIRLTPAFHGSGVPGGHACGVLVEFGGKRVYYAGDTGVFSDMQMLDRFGPIDCAILPIGDNFTMGPEDAGLAASYVNAAVTIPVHYGTWPVIDVNPVTFKAETEAKYGVKVQVVKPGTEYEF